MKTLLNTLAISAALFGAATLATTPAHAADIGVSIGISQPGVYGRIDIGRFPSPVLVAPTPVLVTPRHGWRPEPVYLWVPPGERRDWNHYCGRYNACGAPVYFVQDNWYRQRVTGPRGHERWVEHRDERRDWRADRRADRRHDRREDRREDRRDDRHDNGHGEHRGQRHDGHH